MSFAAFRARRSGSSPSLRVSGRLSGSFEGRPCVRPGYGMSFCCSRANSFDSCDSSFDPEDIMTELVPESERLARLKEIQTAFEQEGEEPYDSVVKLVRSIFHVPIVLVSLVYDDFQWFKAGVGLVVNQTPRCESFCAYTFLPRHPEVLYIPNAREDERFRNNPLVLGPPYIRFYCGVPLMTNDDVRLGSLCIIEDRPRTLDPKGMQLLINIAELTVRELLKSEIGKKTYTDRLSDKFKQPISEMSGQTRAHAIRELWFEHGLEEGVLIVDASTPRWPVVWSNSEWNEICRCSPMRSLWSLVQPCGDQTAEEVHTMVIKQLTTTKHHTIFTALANPRHSSPGPRQEEDKPEDRVYVSCKVCFASNFLSNATRVINLSTASNVKGATPIAMKEGQFIVIRATRIKGLVAECNALKRQDAGASAAAKCSTAKPPVPELPARPVSANTTESEFRTGTPQNTERNKDEDEASILSAFRCLDKAGNGDISKQDFLRVMEKLMPGVGRQRAMTVLEVLDFERNGRIIYPEFIKWLIGKAS
mmetsp:Transcript_6257/g.10468  ORF Transcript_6257/g.10468 Transcript_6257/m.10468 type:complete len:534 (-) Transcript_6257:46-1647(-)